MTQTWYYNTPLSVININHKLDMKDTQNQSRAFDAILKILIVVFFLIVISIIKTIQL